MIFGISASKIPKDPVLSSHGRRYFPCNFNWTSLRLVPGLNRRDGPLIGNSPTGPGCAGGRGSTLFSFRCRSGKRWVGKSEGLTCKRSSYREGYKLVWKQEEWNLEAEKMRNKLERHMADQMGVWGNSYLTSLKKESRNPNISHHFVVQKS